MKIWQTYRNSDETEGRGPMIPDLTFLHEHDAARYIDNQPGVMGRRAKWSNEKYGDWTMKEVVVIDYDVIEAGEKQVKLKLAALAKLTAEEKELLGLTDV
jgi:hypothetical protein